MIPPVSARLALAQSLYWDRWKPELAIACTATLLCQQWRQHEITVRQLRRCLEQIATLERWNSYDEAQDGPRDRPLPGLPSTAAEKRQGRP